MERSNQELLEEGRSYIINGLLAYACGFGLLDEEDIDNDLLENINGAIEGLEAAMPVVISLYEMEKKLSGNPNLTFMEWAEKTVEKHGGDIL